MEDFFKNIFAFHHDTNQKLITLFTEHSDNLNKKMLLLLSHSLNAHNIWNARILNTKNTYKVFKIHPLENCKTIDNENYNTTLEIISKIDFKTSIAYTNSKGKSYENSVQDILFHIANHYTHHRGQLMLLLRQHDIEPIITDYIFYKR